jgi:hypothetical protein
MTTPNEETMTHPDLYADVQQFNREVVGPGVDRTEHGPSMPDYASRDLGLTLVEEECGEMISAVHSGDLAEALDGAVDLIVVTLGLCLRLGISRECFYEAWREVDRANMAKAGGPVSPTGKKLKPAGWTPPDIAAVIARHTPTPTGAE